MPPRGTPIVESYLELIGQSTQVTHDHEILLASSSTAPASTAAASCDRSRCSSRSARSRADWRRRRSGCSARSARASSRACCAPGSTLRARRAGGARRGRPPEPTGSPSTTPGRWRREAWDHYRCDGALHATYWISGWPRIDVSPMFMDALLADSGTVRTVAVTFEPVAPERSAREVEAAITRDRADSELRRRFGQSETARQRQAQEAAGRREAELAAGHGEVRFSGFVTVSGRDEGELRRGVRRDPPSRRPRAPRAAADVRPAGRGLQLHAAARARPAMSAARPAHRVTTRHAQAIYPFTAGGGLGGRGAFIGRDTTGGAFCFDPWVLYDEGVLDDPNAIVIGKLGQGKSALVKTLLWRMLLFGRRAFVLDVKREYGPLCASRRRRARSRWPRAAACGSTRSPPAPRSTPRSSCCARSRPRRSASRLIRTRRPRCARHCAASGRTSRSRRCRRSAP